MAHVEMKSQNNNIPSRSRNLEERAFNKFNFKYIICNGVILIPFQSSTLPVTKNKKETMRQKDTKKEEILFFYSSLSLQRIRISFYKRNECTRTKKEIKKKS